MSVLLKFFQIKLVSVVPFLFGNSTLFFTFSTDCLSPKKVFLPLSLKKIETLWPTHLNKFLRTHWNQRKKWPKTAVKKNLLNLTCPLGAAFKSNILFQKILLSWAAASPADLIGLFTADFGHFFLYFLWFSRNRFNELVKVLFFFFNYMLMLFWWN